MRPTRQYPARGAIKTMRRLAPARLRTGMAPDAGVLQSQLITTHLARAATHLPLPLPAAAGEIITRHTGRGFLAAAATGSRRGERGRHADAGRAADPQPTRSSVVIMPLATRFTELAGCAVPIQQAPMGSVSTPALAVAVADAGGVGSITAQWLAAAEGGATLAGMAAQAGGGLAANFLTGDIDPEAVAAAAARVRIVDFFWADPDPAPVEVAHRAGALACRQGRSLGVAPAPAPARVRVFAAPSTR